MNFEMKHNGSRIFNGTTGPSQSNLHHLNSNQLITKSVHHLNNLNTFNNNNLNQQSNSSYFNLNKNHHLNNYQQHNFYLTPNYHPFYHHHYPYQEKGLYRINSALNLDQYEFETNLKREFGSVSSIGALNNNYPHNNHFNHHHHHLNQIYPITNSTPIHHQNNHHSITNNINSTNQQEHLLSFYSILKEFKKQNLDNNHQVKQLNFVNNPQANKIQDYLRARSEMSNIDLVNPNNLNLITKTTATHLNDSHHKLKQHFTVTDGAFSKLTNHHQHHHSSYLITTNELNNSNSLSAYSNHSLSSKQLNHLNQLNNQQITANLNNNTNLITGSNLTLDNCGIQPSPGLKKKIYKIWEIKSDKNSSKQQKLKMSSESSTNKNDNNSTTSVDGATRAIIKKFTRIGSSKNVNCNNSTTNNNEQNAIQEEYRSSMNTAASTTHLNDDPEVRMENSLKKKAFAHYDCQSLIANLNSATRLCHLLSKRRNTTTGASAASIVSKQNFSALELENGDIDNGDDRSNDLLLSCPYFRNELGGEEERMISLNRITADQTNQNNSNKHIFIHKPNMTSGLALLEDANERRWKLKCCPYQKLSTINTPNLEHLFLIENNDVGATYYRNHFYGLEHQNWFGIDENLGPIAISIRRERVQLENCLIKKNSNPLTTDNNVNNNLSTTISNSTNTISQPPYKNQYRLIIRTSELNVLRGTVFEDCVPNLNLKNNNHNNHHAKEVLDYIASEINLSCLRLGVSNADEQLLRLDEQAQTGKYKVGVLYCKSGQSTEEEMYNNEFGGPAFDEFLTCLGKRIRLKGFDKYRAGLDNKKDTTGLYSVYATFAGCELMFHVSTLLPYTTDKQQILRKQHIGNDIVTIVFQEPDACQFTPKLIRSHFQHVFIIVKVLPSLNGPPKYSVAISRSKDVPVFGPAIPENGIFTKSKQFTDFLLSKIINAENAAHRSEKFRSMAQRTRHEYLKELAQKYVTNTTINDLSSSSAGSKLVSSIFGGSKKSRSARASRDSHFIGDSVIKGAICWEMWVEDFGQSRVIDCLVAISSDSFVIIESSTKDLIFVSPNISILGWNSHPNYIKIFYHQGECILLKCKDPDLDEINEIVNRLKNVTNGCETQEIILKRNNGGQLGFRVSFEGIITQVDLNTHAWLSGLRRYARIVEICKVAIATLTHEQMQDLLKTSITVSITTLPPLDENTPRRGCNLQTCSYITNPVAFSSSNLSSNYENINSAFDRFSRNQQQLNNGLLSNNYLNTSNSNANTGLLNYSNNQSVNSSQHQLMGLPSANTMPSRTNCSSPSASITSKSNYSPTTGIGMLSSNGLSRSKTMLDSSTSSSKKSACNVLCSVPSTPLPFNNQSKPQFIKNSNTASSIASSIQDSLNQLSLSTTSSQANTNNSTNLTQQQVIECSDLGLPAEPIKINLPTSKQTSDYNSDTSSSNEWNSNTWSLSLENSNNRAKLANDDKFACPKTAINSGKFKTPFNIQQQQQPNLTAMNKTADKYTSTTPTVSANSTLLRNQTNSRQSILNSSNNKSTTNSTLQEDLLRLINPDSYLSSPDNLTENLNSSNPASNESSNTQYSTPYSSLERSNTSCSNTNSNNQSSTNEDKIIAQPAVVSSFNNQLQRQLDKQSIDHFNRQQSKLLEKSNSMDYLCKIDKQSTDNKKNQSVIKSKKFSFDSNSAFTIDQDWPSLISNANKALAVTQQANSLPTTSLVQTANNKISTLKNELQQLNNKAGSLKENDDCKDDQTTCPSPATIATAKLNHHRNSLDQWILEFENFSKNAASNLFGNDAIKQQFSTSGNSSIDQVEDDCFQQTTNRNQMEPSQLDAEKVKNLESRLKQLQSDLVKEQSNKMTLENQVKHLEEENRRLHTESITAAAQLRKFTDWFFQNIKN